MKLVSALLRPEQLPAVKTSLHDAGVQKFTAATVMGTAPRTEQRLYRGVEQKVGLFRRVRVEVACTDSDLEKVIEAISRGAHEMGGWGTIFVTELHDVVSIWTGERGLRVIS
jgi:nitrogen regulatory protein P-II 2